MATRIGFTGTQRGMTERQKAVMWEHIQRAAGDFHHGDCVGADSDAHDIAEMAGLVIFIHPPENPSKRAFKVVPASRIKKPKPYLDRNKDIVIETEELIATPGEMTEQLRSGTWSTVRFARKIGRPVTIIFPDGTKSHG
jgi:hypothetical protein